MISSTPELRRWRMSAALEVAPLLEDVAGDAAEPAPDDVLAVMARAEDGPAVSDAPAADVADVDGAAVADCSLPADEAG